MKESLDKLLGTLLLAAALVVAMWVPSVGSAQAAPSSISQAAILLLDQVIDTALAHHPALRGEREERAGADAELLAAAGAFDPRLKGDVLSYASGGYSGSYGAAYVEQPLPWQGSTLFGGYRLGDGSFPVYEDYYYTNSGGEAQLGVELSLLRDGAIDRRRTALQKAELGRDLADSLIEQRKIEVARAAALTYWDWTAARNKIRVYRRLLDVALVRDRQIAERVQRGDLPRFDLVDNQRTVLQRQSQLLSAERAVSSSEFQLALFLRTPEGVPQRVDTYQALERIPLPLFAPQSSLDVAVEEAASARPEFKNIRTQHQQNERELILARNQILPRLDLRVFSANDYGTGSERRDETEIKAGVRVEIPLATRSQRGQIGYYEARRRKLAFSELFLRERVRADVQDALNALEIARQKVTLARGEVMAALDLAKGEQTRFEHGDSSLIFVNLREQAAADAEVREIEALQEYQKAFTAFEATLARIQKRQQS